MWSGLEQKTQLERHVLTIFQKLNRLVLFFLWEPSHFYVLKKFTLQIHKFMNPFFMGNNGNLAKMGKLQMQERT